MYPFVKDQSTLRFHNSFTVGLELHVNEMMSYVRAPLDLSNELELLYKLLLITYRLDKTTVCVIRATRTMDIHQTRSESFKKYENKQIEGYVTVRHFFTTLRCLGVNCIYVYLIILYVSRVEYRYLLFSTVS